MVKLILSLPFYAMPYHAKLYHAISFSPQEMTPFFYNGGADPRNVKMTDKVMLWVQFFLTSP